MIFHSGEDEEQVELYHITYEGVKWYNHLQNYVSFL